MSATRPALRIRYEYECDQELRPAYAHGVWGGINPQGELELNFYTESDKFPPYSERVLSVEGELSDEVTPVELSAQGVELKTVSRRIGARVILSRNSAHAVVDWLLDKLELLENGLDEADLYFESGNESGTPQ